jgi:hypothetical protein
MAFGFFFVVGTTGQVSASFSMSGKSPPRRVFDICGNNVPGSPEDLKHRSTPWWISEVMSVLRLRFLGRSSSMCSEDLSASMKHFRSVPTEGLSEASLPNFSRFFHRHSGVSATVSRSSAITSNRGTSLVLR